MKKKNKPYTRLTLESYFPADDDYRRFTVETNKWDSTLEEMADLFQDLLLGFGFHPDPVEKLFDE